jgi:Flp pilus assembly protein TadG
MKKILRNDQNGVAAIEFSLVFALIFATFWAIISYALPFFLYQTMNHAVAEASRTLVKYESPTPTNATDELKAQLNKYLPSAFFDKLTFPTPTILSLDLTGNDEDGNPVTYSYKTLSIKVVYPGCNSSSLRAHCITPALNLLGASIPNLGPYTAETEIRLSRN